MFENTSLIATYQLVYRSTKSMHADAAYGTKLDESSNFLICEERRKEQGLTGVSPNIKYALQCCSKRQVDESFQILTIKSDAL